MSTGQPALRPLWGCGAEACPGSVDRLTGRWRFATLRWADSVAGSRMSV